MKSLFLLIISGIVMLSCTGSPKKGETYYQNPVMSGDYPDPTIVRDGNDYYMTHSSSEYYPGLLIWHSTDMIHWERISHALTKFVGSVWAPDLIKHGDTWYIYFPAGGTNWVVTAPSPKGPWSEPIDLLIPHFIDPGHVADAKGKRSLYLSGGCIVPLSDDGLSVAGEIAPNYKGWRYPAEWEVECFCLESPKSTFLNGYFYNTVAEGGTAGPATSHMVVSGRAASPYGPFENSPYNPIVHTYSSDERWWSQGHGTLVDDVDGQWWLVYHAFEKDSRTLGRQTLLLPIEWTNDNWFRVPEGVKSADLLRAPAGKPFAGNTQLSDDFSGDRLGLQWQFFKHYEPERVRLGDGKLTLQAKGTSFMESAPLLVNMGDKRYEAVVEYWIDESVTAGIVLFYNEHVNARIAVCKEQFIAFNRNDELYHTPNQIGNHGFLRALNDRNKIGFYYSADAKNWIPLECDLDLTDFNHNIHGGYLSHRTGIYAFGEGNAVFDNFVYRKLED